MLLLNSETSAANKQLSRDEIGDKYKWCAEDLFESDGAWEVSFKEVESKITKYTDYEGKLEDPDTLYSLLKFEEEIGVQSSKLYLYAMLKKDIDLSNSNYLAMHDRIVNLSARLGAASAFINPEILAIEKSKIDEVIAEDQRFDSYKHYFEELYRTKEHILDKEKEELLAMSSEILGAPHEIFSVFTNADLRLGNVKGEDGEETNLTHGLYSQAMYSRDREYRERVYETYYKSFMDYANTLSVSFNSNLRSHIFSAKARKYNSVLEASLDSDNIPVDIYKNLIKNVSNNLEPLHRFAEIKKKMLKVSSLKPYDTYVTLFDIPNKKFEYDEAVEILHKALSPLGEEYIGNLMNAINNRWVDVYETKGKRSGAYSTSPTFGCHPYVLLNWTYLLNDVFTFAHEMGHNMHSFYTATNQPFQYASYTTFLAEVASIFNEALLSKYLLSNSTDKNSKLYIIEKNLNDIQATFYRQTMFAEFELGVYERTEANEALSVMDLNQYFAETYKKYWGPAMEVPVQEHHTWSRIPHFYYGYYVFQYATGLASAEALANQVLSEGKSAVDRYLKFLKSGSSDYSVNILKKAGVDVSEPEPVLAVTKKMDSLLTELESLI